ncbi:KpsF/GutQ family sugar-phosphate isomerase [Staphylococcus equorum]|uniref:KpsF/GutQ family sugar-phosphate isomerase n=1 Tax=Staphylococcus equorum TaxID=246432 RepID=UPI002DB9CA31|nr:KpsF/GutQ family sugar-phosphate isomerase [Staphylococcus equorum]MEB7723125.1 KpsF/GutQ family sugar-phosphate isomerase [Staphylococcus equorum]
MTFKGKRDYSSDIRDVFHMEANAIFKNGNRIGEEYNKAIDLILESNGRVIITGIGKSGHVGRKMASTLSSIGTPAYFLHPTEALHGDLGMVTKYDVVLAISNSGESEEILNILPSTKSIGAKIIALVGKRKSTLSDKAEVTLCYGPVEEACPLGLAPTTSTTLTLVIGDAIAFALSKARDFKPEIFALYHPGGLIGRQLLLTVEDLLEDNRKNPIAFTNINVKNALFKMTESGLDSISIVNKQKELIGILTDGDIRRALQSGDALFERPIEHIFNKLPVTIDSNTLASEALKLMKEKQVNVLPVVNHINKPIAMLHMHDLTK